MLLIFSVKNVHISGDNATRFGKLRVRVHLAFFNAPGAVRVEFGETDINLDYHRVHVILIIMRNFLHGRAL